MNKEKYKIIDFERKGNVVRFYLGSKTKKWGWVNENYVNFSLKDRKCDLDQKIKNNQISEDYAKDDIDRFLKSFEDDARSDTYWGDDWDDAPYEHNAGLVYEEFVKGYTDIAFSFDDLVLEPSNTSSRIVYSKNDMKDRKVPCIIIAPKEIRKDQWDDDFNTFVGSSDIKHYYFGDEMEIQDKGILLYTSTWRKFVNDAEMKTK